MAGKRERGGLPKGWKITKLRVAKAWVTSEDLARHSKLDVKTVTEMEAGKRKDWSSLKAVAAALGVDVGEIAELQVPKGQGNPDEKPLGRTLTAVTPVFDFIGRGQEQTDILALLKGGGRVCISAIKAAGGMGKTQLAAMCAEQLREAFPHVLWLRLDGMTTPKKAESLLQDVIRYFRPTDKLPETVGELLPLYLGVLHGQRVLIVLDNAENAAQVKPLFDAAVPNTVAFLVTSRNMLSIPDHELKRVDLKILSERDAVSLLRGIIQMQLPDFDDPQLATVAKLCGHMPLALRVAGTYLRDHHNLKAALPIYIRNLKSEPLEHLKLGPDADRNVYRVLSHSVRQLVGDNEKLAERFQILSVFPGDFADDAAAGLWNLDPDETFTELADLIDRSLVEFDATTERYHLHDLMRPAAREAFDLGHTLAANNAERLDNAGGRFAGCYRLVLQQIQWRLEKQDIEQRLMAFAIYDMEFENIKIAQTLVAKHFHEWPDDDLAAQAVVDFALTGVECHGLRLCLRTELIPWHEAAIRGAQVAARSAQPAVRGTRKVDYRECEGMCLANLSDYWRLLGDLHKSIDCSNQALVIAREKNEPRREIVPLINLGCSYFKLGQIDQALQYLEYALKKAGDEGDQRNQSKALLNLGACWVQLNDLTKAYEHLMRCFEISIKMEDENAIAMTEISLGDWYMRSADLIKAVDFLEAGLEIAQNTSDLRTERLARNKLGLARERLGQPREAIKHYERELDITKIIGDHCGEGNVLRNLGNAWYALGDPQKPIECYKQALISCRKIGDRQGEAESMWNLALALGSLNRRAEGITSAEVAFCYFAEIGHPRAEMIRQQIEVWKSAPPS